MFSLKEGIEFVTEDDLHEIYRPAKPITHVILMIKKTRDRIHFFLQQIDESTSKTMETHDSHQPQHLQKEILQNSYTYKHNTYMRKTACRSPGSSSIENEIKDRYTSKSRSLSIPVDDPYIENIRKITQRTRRDKENMNVKKTERIRLITYTTKQFKKDADHTNKLITTW